MKARGIRLVPIIDAGVKIEDGYDVYEEGLKNGYFCTNQDGTPFVASVWPGRVHFPDMLNRMPCLVWRKIQVPAGSGDRGLLE